MSEAKFPEAQKLHDAEISAWTYVFKCLTDLEKRIKDLERKMNSIKLK